MRGKEGQSRKKTTKKMEERGEQVKTSKRKQEKLRRKEGENMEGKKEIKMGRQKK